MSGGRGGTRAKGLTATAPPTSAARIEHIQRLMAGGQFRRGKTYRELAVEWGLSESAVQHYTAEAARANAKDDNWVRELQMDTVSELTNVIDTTRRLALSPRGDRSHFRTMVLALDKRAEVAGIKAANQVSMQVGIFTDSKGNPLPELVQYEAEVSAAWEAVLEEELADDPARLARIYSRIADMIGKGPNDGSV